MVTFLTLTRQFFLHTTPIDIINSWGISKMYATQIIKNVNGEDFTMAALVMQVNGFQFQGKVYIALDEGSDYYRIYGEKDGTTKEYHHDIAFDELGDVLDSMIGIICLRLRRHSVFLFGQRIALDAMVF